MPINLGDGIISVLVETAQANAQLEQFGASVPAKLAPAATALQAPTSAVEGFGKKVQDTSSTVDDLSKKFATGAAGAREVGDVMELSGEKGRFSMYEARGEMQLIDELIGIRLPRHVVSFIAEIPGVGVALSAAFSATAVLFIIEAIAKGVEKLIEWREEAHKLELAQETFGASVGASFIQLDEKLLRTGIKADELRGDHLAALAKELQLINLQSLHDLVHEFETLDKAAGALFKHLETSWFTFNLGAKGAEHALEDFLAKYNFLLEVDRDKKGAADLLAGTKKSAEDVLALMLQFNNLKDLPTDTWEQRNAKNAQEIQILNELKARQVDINELKARSFGIDEKTVEAQRVLVATFAAQENAKKKIEENEAGEEANKKKEEYDKIQTEQERALKAQLAADKREAEEEDKLEDDRRNKYIADFQEREKEKIAATRAGSEERMKILDASIKEEEAHGFQDTAFYKSLQVQKVQAVQARVAQEQKAELDAEKRDLTGAEQDAKREVETAKESGREQERALQDLGRAKVLSQDQTSKRLIAAYEDEKNKVLAVLNNLLREEQALMEKAAVQLNQAKLNPGVTPEQVSQAETMLKQIQNAVANTEAQIAKVKSDASVKELALERNRYGQALAMAVAFGNQQLASQLRHTHDLLLAKQKELQAEKDAANAKGLTTKATNDQIKTLEREVAALKKEEQQLELNAHKGLSAWKQFSEGFRDESKKNTITLQEMAEKMRQDLREFAADIGQEFAAMLQGQESFGEAMAHATEKLIGKMAQQWGEYFAAKAIADIFWNPALGAAEFAAAAALFTVGSLMSSLASDSGGRSAGATGTAGTPAPAAGSTGSAAGQQPTHTVNVVHLASGGLVDRPTLAVVGDSSSGGRSREAVIPLDDPRAMAAMHKAFGGGGGTTVNVHVDGMISADNLHQVVKQITRDVNAGRVKLLASNSIRVTRRS